MKKELTFTLDNGNAKTIVSEDKKLSALFWGKYFTHCYQDEGERDDYFLEPSLDLMGNPIPYKQSKGKK